MAQQLERKALYNLLRLNWERDQSFAVESWQVEDYRKWTDEDLLSAIQQLDGGINRQQFLSWADQCDSPEELTAALLEVEAPPEIEDQVYLIIFELWRRWVPENPTLSIFCDELDYCIQVDDAGEAEDDEPIQDALANLLDILDESSDEGGEPREVFLNVAAHCANDLESFLYDYIAQQIDDENLQYASELLEGYSPYMDESLWFCFLQARLAAATDIDQANHLIEELIEREAEEPDLDFNLEMLDFLSQTGDRQLFIKLAEQTLHLLEKEEDLLELLRCMSQYYCCLDADQSEKRVDALIEDRTDHNPNQELDRSDPSLGQIRQILLHH